VRDYCNFTTTKLTDSFSLAGTLFQNANTGYGVVGYPDILMPMCNSSASHGNYTLTISDLPADKNWQTWGWNDFKLPSLNASFNAKTANLTLEGKFDADLAWPLADDVHRYPDVPELDYNDSVMGIIRFTFKGALNTYHSDVLNMNTSTPTWLRTVGFGNYSLSAGSTSGGPGRPGVGAGAIVVLLFVFAVFI
jgi:hypothetical protein